MAANFCANCGTPVDGSRRTCPRCGALYPGAGSGPAQTPAPAPASPMAISALSPRTLGLLGAVVLAIGTFLPVLSVPIVGTVTYFNNGRGDGVFALLLAAIAAIFTWRAARWLIIPGGLALLLIGYSLLNAQRTISDLQAGATGLGALVAQSVSLQWGWLVLLAGAILILIAWWQARAQARA